jgi:hypothetical protein
MSGKTGNRPAWLCVFLWAWLLVPSRPMRAGAEPAKEPVPAVNRVTLSDGATIEMVGVCEYPIRPESWWRADGSPLPKPPVDKVLGFQPPVANRLMRVFVLDVVTGHQADVDGPTGPKDQYDGQTASTRDTATPRGLLSQRYLIAAIRPSARIDLAVDYAAGPWRTVSTASGQQSKLAAVSARPQLIWENIVTGKVVPEIWVAHNLDLDAKHLRLIAVDNENVLHETHEYFVSESGHVQIRKALFRDVPVNRVKEYRLVTHPTDRRFCFLPVVNPAEAAPTEEIVWGPAAEDSHATRISAACRIHMKMGRIIAIDERDRECLLKFGECRSIGNLSLMTAEFTELPLARVKEFRFQIRENHHHIEFRNVSLHAGQKSPAQLYLNGKRYVPKAESNAR